MSRFIIDFMARCHSYDAKTVKNMQDIRLFLEIVAIFGSSVLTWYLTKKFERKPRLIAGTTRAAHIRINKEQILSNHTLIVRNDGKKEAKNVQIIHLNLPELYQVLPAVPYTIEDLKDGKAIVFPSLVPGEEITICYMYPEFLFRNIHGIIKHDEGQAKYINILLTREYSSNTLMGMRCLMLLGIITITYWLVLLILRSWDYILTLDKTLS